MAKKKKKRSTTVWNVFGYLKVENSIKCINNERSENFESYVIVDNVWAYLQNAQIKKYFK